MTICGGCNGTGKVRCSGCHGRGHISRFTGHGEVEVSPCLVCGGTGRMRHDFCGGRGRVGPDVPVEPPVSRRRPANEDALAGRWNGGGGAWYELVKQGDSYQVTEHGPLGQTGSGTGTLSGNVVMLEITNILFGHYSI